MCFRKQTHLSLKLGRLSYGKKTVDRAKVQLKGAAEKTKKDDNNTNNATKNQSAPNNKKNNIIIRIRNI